MPRASAVKLPEQKREAVVEFGWMGIEMLIEAGYLDPEDVDDDRRIGAAISRLLAGSAERWMKGRR
jgi:hypothetical protein